MTLLHTFDPDDSFRVARWSSRSTAGGQVTNPELSGRVQFDNVNIAMDGVPNGLSNMNGTLVFNDDRLQVENLTATTGGGRTEAWRIITFPNGVYADLTATGDVVRVRHVRVECDGERESEAAGRLRRSAS